ncbi:hypothetical protein ACFYY2_33605 [Streptomyces sp. NPDC001822]|uniref:hypothetical protein n=1 Tax=Streptomyces sp. NPDC001822 TaxID=3364614 RepID=UPI0036943A94
MTVEPIADLQAALQQAVAELSFEAGQQAATDPERAEHLMAVTSAMEETLQRTETPQKSAGSAPGTDPVDAALRLLHAAREAIETATEDKTARRVRSGSDAQRQQDAIRRILGKIKVEADDDALDPAVVDAELVED